MSLLTGDQVVEIIKSAPATIAAVASLVVALKAQKSARSAQVSAAAAHEKASDATREQLTFALRRAVRDAKAQGVSVIVPDFQSTEPPGEVGATHE